MKNKEISLKLSAVALAILLASCGGDGYYGSASGEISQGNGSNNGIEPPKVATLNISDVDLQDTQGSKITALTTLGGIASVKITNENGEPVSGVLVKFSSDNLIFGTSNSSVLSNADGIATIFVKPADSSVTGAYTISAVADSGDLTAQSRNTAFTIEPIKTILENLTSGSSELDAGGMTNITLVTKDPVSNIVQNNILVSFTASCGTFTANNVLSVNQGNILTTYQAIDTGGQLCSGPVTITAQTAGGTTGTVNLTVMPAKANSLIYTSNEVKLGVVTSGSSASGQIEFTVYSDKIIAPDQEVKVEITKAPSDLSFVQLNNKSPATLKTDLNGKVLVNIYPGTIPGPVEIKASLVSDPTINALSKNVSVATGRVTQKAFSLSIEKQALQFDTDGDTTTITARLADRVGNKVPDGTVVSFVSEGGSIDPNCSTVNGQCSVTLMTQDPRPSDNRVTVLAFVEGDKSYTDVNSDNRYTVGIDTLTHNIGHFFKDDNENNTFESHLGEFLYKRDLKGASALCAPSTLKHPNIADTCDNGLEAVLREQIIFAFSHDTPTITNEALSEGVFSFKLFGNGALSVPMPTGTTVAVTTEDRTNNDKACTVAWLRGSETVGSTFAMYTPTTFADNSTEVFYSYEVKDCAKDDRLMINVTSPNNKVSRVPFVIQ